MCSRVDIRSTRVSRLQSGVVVIRSTRVLQSGKVDIRSTLELQGGAVDIRSTLADPSLTRTLSLSLAP